MGRWLGFPPIGYVTFGKLLEFFTVPHPDPQYDVILDHRYDGHIPHLYEL